MAGVPRQSVVLLEQWLRKDALWRAAIKVAGAKDREPLNRVLTGTMTALRARQNLPRRDRRRAGARWLRPGWPEAFVLSVHREMLVEALARNDTLRQEVRDLLKVPDAPALEGLRARLDGEVGTSATPVGEFLAAELAIAADPVALLEAAAVDPDPTIAEAASPYLNAQLPVPEMVPPTAIPGPVAKGARSDIEAHRQLRDARADIKALRRDLRTARQETIRVRAELTAAIDRAKDAKADASALREQLPSRRQRQALAQASAQQSKIIELQRRLKAERAARQYDLREKRDRLAEAEHALALAQEGLESERRGRRGLEADLGDAAGRARRLKPLTEREAASARREASAMLDGPGKTRTLRRAARLEELSELLSELYELDEVTGSAPVVGPRGQRGKPHVTDTRPRGLTVTALGGANHIGGSALLIQAGATRLLIDAGLKPQAHISRPGPDRIDDAIAEPLDAVVVTHAHADHAGFVPWVVERQRRTSVLCSPETKALLPTVWADSVRVMGADADASSQRGEHYEPPYGDAEVAQAEDTLRAVGYGQSHAVGDFEVTLFKAGHILGAAGVVIRAGECRVVVTGDIDDRGQASVGAAEIPPRLARGGDLLVIETTYCDAVHRDRGREGDDLVLRAEEVLDAGGRILIPAFGLGRAQEIALLIGKRMPNVDVLVDGLARDISELYALNGAPEVLRGRVRKVTHRERQILGFHEGVVITTSGMLTGGAAIPWAQAVLLEPESALFLCGHQDEEAPGRELEELANADPEAPRRVRLRDEQGRPIDIDVASAVYRYNLSAHADRNGLISIVDEIRPKAIMLVHGESGPQALFRSRLGAAGYEVVDNREPWDSEGVVPDDRLARRRHGTRQRVRGPGGR